MQKWEGSSIITLPFYSGARRASRQGEPRGSSCSRSIVVVLFCLVLARNFCWAKLGQTRPNSAKLGADASLKGIASLGGDASLGGMPRPPPP